MTRTRFIAAVCAVLTLPAAVGWAQAREIVGHEELAMLHDAAGWEYVSISDPNNGFQTQAVCFDPQRPGTCEGKLFFRSDGTFTQTITGHGKSMHRGGTYKLDGSDITFFDEHGTRDGPYSLKIDVMAKTLTVDATRAGVGVHMELLLEQEFKKRKARKQTRSSLGSERESVERVSRSYGQILPPV